jgi:pantothenate synthetase
MLIEWPPVRESDGLAMSSRNARLTTKQRADAPRIQRALTAAVFYGDVLLLAHVAGQGVAAHDCSCHGVRV